MGLKVFRSCSCCVKFYIMLHLVHCFWEVVKGFPFLQNFFERTFYCLYKGNATA